MNLILFDVSGTLVHSCDFGHEVMLHTLSKLLGAPKRTLEDFCKAETDTAFVEKVWDLVKGEEIGKKDWKNIYEVYQSTLLEFYQKRGHRFSPIDGAPDLLRNLQNSKSWGFAIVSTSWHELAHLSLRSSGFYTRRMHVVSGEGIRKKADLLSKAIDSSKRWYGVDEFSKITYVGDDTLDLTTCQELKLPFIEVTPQSEKSAKGFVYPEKGQFIRLARRAAVPSRQRGYSIGNLIGIRA